MNRVPDQKALNKIVKPRSKQRDYAAKPGPTFIASPKLFFFDICFIIYRILVVERAYAVLRLWYNI